MSTTVLMADDDSDDYLLIAEALSSTASVSEVRRVADGAELLDYLTHKGAYHSGVAGEDPAPRPSLILLDLSMPDIDGREALRTIKADIDLRDIPVVVLTTSDADDDVRGAYELGASGYITKPTTISRLEEVLDALTRYWFGTVELPADRT